MTNENYTGTLVQGKGEKVNYKVERVLAKPEEKWIRVENAHEAIISREDFELVQELLKFDIRAGDGEKKAHKYVGLLFCGDCMEPMVRRVTKYKEKKPLLLSVPERTGVRDVPGIIRWRRSWTNLFLQG